MKRRLLLGLVTGLAAAAVATPAALGTLSGATATLTVTEAHFVGSCNPVTNLIQLNATGDLKVVNNTGGPITLASAAFTAEGHHGVSNTAFTAAATANGLGSLSLSGITINNGANATVNGISFVSLVPCDTNDAQLCVVVSVLNPQADIDKACADVISGGNAVPVGTLGFVGLALLLGLTLVLGQRTLVARKRRERSTVDLR
jgi:hypothetical protein